MRGFAVLVVALALAAPVSAATVVGIGEQANGKSVALHRGDTLAVTLPANPSTGYAWKVSAVDRHVLAATANGFVAPTTKLVGAPGVAVLLFRAAAAGKTVLRLAYVAPGTGKAGQRFSVTVRVA